MILDYILLNRGIKFLGANLIFAVSISNFFCLSLSTQLFDKLQPTAFNNNQQIPTTNQPLLLGP